jgi:hypothetical protein
MVAESVTHLLKDLKAREADPASQGQWTRQQGAHHHHPALSNTRENMLQKTPIN